MRNEFIVPIGLMVVWVVSDSHGCLGTDQSQKPKVLCRRFFDTISVSGKP